MDLPSIKWLENYLGSFEGAIVIVSHDRYFLDRIVDHTFAFEGDGVIKDFPGNYTDYRLWVDEQASANKKTKGQKEVVVEPEVVIETPKVAKRKLSFKELKEFETLEKEVAELEVKKVKLTEQLSSGDTAFDEIADISKKLEDIIADLEMKELRWLELSEFV